MSMDFDALHTLPGITQEDLDQLNTAILALARFETSPLTGEVIHPVEDREEDDGDSWDWFGLSYASWLVLPRVALQSMPVEWQAKFFTLVRELDETVEFPEGYTGEFAVTMKNGNKFVKNVLPHYRHNTLPRKAHRQ